MTIRYNCDSAVFRHCEFRKVEIPIKYAIDQYNDMQLIIEQCLFKECSLVLDAQGGRVYLRNNKIEDCTWGIYITSPDAEITDNFITKISERALQVGSTDSKKQIIKNNYISKSGIGIVLIGAPTHVVENNVITENREAGILYSSTWANAVADTIKNNIIAYNKMGLSIYETTPAPHAIISNNTIKHNNWGVIFGDTNPDIEFTYNCVDSNTDYNASSNQKVNNLYLPHNYWGSTDSMSIHNKMFDYNKDFKFNKIVFAPFLPQADPSCKGVGALPNPTNLKNNISTTNNVTVTPNPMASSFTIKTSSNQNIKEVAVYNVTGARLTSLSVSGTEAAIDASSYPAGMYIYHVTFENNTTVTGKLEKL
jgi:hypothetical protein